MLIYCLGILKVTIEELLDYTFEVLGKDNRHIQSLSFVSDSRVTTPLLTEGPRLRWEVNQAFLDLEPEEIRFALLYEFTPKPTGITKVFWQGYLLALTAVLLFSYLTDWSGSGLFLLVPGAFANPRTSRATMAAHLDQVIAITKNPISARSYLVKVHGELYGGHWHERLSTRIHPIRAYIRYGKDERLKAILKSDLVHPTQLEKYS